MKLECWANPTSHFIGQRQSNDRGMYFPDLIHTLSRYRMIFVNICESKHVAVSILLAISSLYYPRFAKAFFSQDRHVFFPIETRELPMHDFHWLYDRNNAACDYIIRSWHNVML